MEHIEKCKNHMRYDECICLTGISKDGRKENGAETFEEINSQAFSKYDSRHHL